MDKLSNSTPEDYIKKESTYVEILENHANWREIPLINHTSLDSLKDGTLVRFRGMIQDMLDPEFYLEKYEVVSRQSGEKIRIQEGKYRDCLVMSSEESVNHDSRENVHGERRTLFLVSVPGLNDWSLEIEKKKLNSMDKNATELAASNEIEFSGGIKRTCDELMDVDNNVSEEIAVNKRLKTDNQPLNSNSSNNCCLSSEYLLNSPISDRPGKACMVKIYKEFEKHSLNTLVDVIGFLSVDPALDGSTMERDENDFEDMNEFQAANPPPSLIPRIHAISIKILEHSNPLLDSSVTDFSVDENFNMELIHKHLKTVLTQCFFGDSLAAEYLISHLISTVYVRTDLETVGQFSLNLCNIPNGVYENYISQFYSIIESLLPASHYLPMSLQNLNEKQFIPIKDYTTNKLTSGLLQLAPHTHLVLDETCLQPGKLETSGVNAVQNLSNLIKNQQIKYNFKFYDLEFNTNIPVLVFSEGRSMLPNNFQVPINADPECISLIEETLKAAKHYLQPKLDTIRMYLTLSKISNFELKTGDSAVIENDFVEMRKLNSNTDANVLHKHLTLSRLLGIARGKKCFDKDCWQMAKEFEIERISRLSKMPKSKGIQN